MSLGPKGSDVPRFTEGRVEGFVAVEPTEDGKVVIEMNGAAGVMRHELFDLDALEAIVAQAKKNRGDDEGEAAPVPIVAIDDVLDERMTQDRRWGTIPERIEAGLSYDDWILILTEEVGELAEAVLEEKFGGGPVRRIREEAVQVAAVGLAIVEFLDTREGR